MRVVADASALAAILLDEEGADGVAAKLQGATLCAPELLKFELANAVLKKARRQPDRAAAVLQRLADGLDAFRKIQWHDVNAIDVAVLAHVTGLSVYDASYLWLAGWLEADLVTLDKRLASCLRG